VWRYHVVTVAALAFAGCGNISTRPAGTATTLQEALQNLDVGLASIPYLNDSDLLSDERGQRYEAARSLVREKQCVAGTANPLLLTSLPTKVRLTGSFDEGASAKFSGLKPGEKDGTARLLQGNRVEIPLRISTLTAFPNEYLKDVSALLETKGLPEEMAQKLKREVPETYEKLTARVGRLVNAYDPRACSRFVQWRPERSANIFIPPTY